MSLEISMDMLQTNVRYQWKVPPTFCWKKHNIMDIYKLIHKCRWKFPPTFCK